jgi:hypothetical protein
VLALRNRCVTRRAACWLAVCILLFSLPAARSAEPSAPVSAQELLDAVVAGLPRDPLHVNGELIVRKRHGVVQRRLKFEMDLRWGAVPSTASYLLRDAFGTDLEQFTVTRDAAGVPRFSYAAGNPLVAAPVPDLFRPVQETDIGWMDLALTFLWWKQGKVVGSEKILDRDCYVVEIPAPAEERKPEPTDIRYASVRVWIEKEARMLLQAEGLDAQGQPLRRLWVRSFKKFDDRWMIKDMEVQQFSGDHRTKLVVQEARDARGPLSIQEPPSP